jgi:hypothetical protein
VHHPLRSIAKGMTSGFSRRGAKAQHTAPLYEGLQGQLPPLALDEGQGGAVLRAGAWRPSRKPASFTRVFRYARSAFGS